MKIFNLRNIFSLVLIFAFNFDVNAQNSTIEEVIVSAEKRDESLQDISQAVSALTDSDLENKNIESFVDLSAIVPGVTVSKNEGYKTVISIRGVGNETNQNAIAAPSVAFHIDGVFIASPFSLLTDFIDIERIEVNLFRGRSPSDRWQRVFGGQVIGQALVAASRTVENRVCHSLHAYFLRAGDPKVPILYEVDRARDGRSFTSRRVVAVQHGKKIFNLSASFQIEEEGLNHQDQMPDVSNYSDLPSEHDLRKKIIENVPEEFKDLANATTLFFNASPRYVNANSAPAPASFCDIPQAIDRSLATPIINPFLPLTKLIYIFSKINVAFVPPNPKLFESTAFIFKS